MTMPNTSGEPRFTANDGPAGRVEVPDVHLFDLVDLLAEAFVARLKAANDNAAPNGEWT